MYDLHVPKCAFLLCHACNGALEYIIAKGLACWVCFPWVIVKMSSIAFRGHYHGDGHDGNPKAASCVAIGSHKANVM